MLTNITKYLDATAKKYPDKIAFTDGVNKLTFAELRNISHRIAVKICESGFFMKPIAIFMEKSPNAIAANFSAVYSGNYYITLDREMPLVRIEQILQTLKPAIIICDDSTVSVVEQVSTDTNSMTEIWLYDEVSQTELTSESEKAIEAAINHSIDLDPLYVVFTSGSSGIPKGVTACHRSVIDYIENLSELLKVDSTTVFGNQAPLYVDACLKEVYTGIKTGSTAVLIPKEKFMFPVKLIEFLNEHKINTICWVSSALSMVAGFKTFECIKPKHLHTVAFGSELFPVKNLNIWRDALPNARFINLYGPTEATGMSSFYEVNRKFAEDERIPIGKAFKNTEILLIGKDGTVIESNVSEVAGEICIRGSCLSLGYYNDFEKTTDSFVQNPQISVYPDLIYKTGDLGEYNSYGELVYIARKDYQIKHMGYRIELTEIEATFAQSDEITLVCCLYDNIKGKILLYYVGEFTPADAVKALKQKLPRYMLPNKTFRLEQMPLTPNGKIDRTKLMEIYNHGDS
ncbi:MAG: AMP-binding protein [Oscillospiraceae bacterium]|nr:AMP-binding protein [Oscillospiraceae bacterium]